MKTVNCPFCPQKLLIVPDLKAMDKAVAKHAKEHIPNTKSYLHVRVSNALTARVLQEISFELPAQKGCYPQ
jgi:hypothetical protein